MRTPGPEGISRREFLHVTAAAGAVGSLGLTPPDLRSERGRQPQGARGGAGAEWFDRPMRWAQLTLVENDPGQFDPTFWLDYFRRLHADAATLSAGGIVAYYPTEIPLHHRSGWLGTMDPFTVHVRLPEGARPSRVRLLTAGVTAATQVANGTARLTVPSVDLHEVIAIDL